MSSEVVQPVLHTMSYLQALSCLGVFCVCVGFCFGFFLT